MAHALWRETDGNPFFVVELLRHLDQARAAGSDVARCGVPASVHEVIGRRVASLSAEAGRVLSIAAVIGRDFDLPLLAGAAGLSEDRVLAILEEAAAVALVLEIEDRLGEFSFAHALIRHTLYEELGPTRRAALHRLVGEALEDLGGEDPGPLLTELAHHWLAATRPADVDKAIGYLRRAADRSLAELAYEQAALYYERALGLAQPHDRGSELRCDLLLGLGDAQRRAGDPAYRDSMAAAFELARRLREPVRMGQAALGSSRPGSWFTATGQVDDVAVGLHEDALAALGDDESSLRAQLLAGLAVQIVFAPDRARRQVLCDEALAVARRIGDPSALARVLSGRAIALCDPTTVAERLEIAAELARLARRLDNVEADLQSRLYRTMALFEAGAVGEAERELGAAGRLSAQLRQPYYQFLTSMTRTMRALLAGPRAAEEAIDETFRLGWDVDQPDAMAAYQVQRSRPGGPRRRSSG